MLSACAPPSNRPAALGVADARHGAADPKPRFTDHDFITADGQVLPLRKWLPQGQVKAVILALHGFNDYSNAFAAPGEAWAKDGIATYAYDQRGFGAAPGRGRWPGHAALAADAATACDILRRLYPGMPLYLLGESMGGAVAVVAMTGESGIPIPDVDGVILVAPAVWGRSTMDLLPRVALWAGVRLMPGLTLTGRGLHIQASDNIAMLRALGRDPLVIKDDARRYDLGSGQSDGRRSRLGPAAACAVAADVRRRGRDHPEAADPPLCPGIAARSRRPPQPRLLPARLPHAAARSRRPDGRRRCRGLGAGARSAAAFGRGPRRRPWRSGAGPTKPRSSAR